MTHEHSDAQPQHCAQPVCADYQPDSSQLPPHDRFHHSLAQIERHAAAAARHAESQRSIRHTSHGDYTALPSRARVLSVEGSDPIGGAGTMADMKAFTAHGVFGYAAMTCVCAQNTQGVTDIVNMEPEFLRKQLIAVSDDGVIDSMKIGMLGTPQIVDCVRDWLVELLRDYERRGLPRPWIVIDPVMYAKSGDSLLTPDAEKELLTILPLADIITPNVPELAALAAATGTAEEATEGAAAGTAATPAMPRTWDEAVGMACSVARNLGVRVYAKAGMFALEASEKHTKPGMEPASDGSVSRASVGTASDGTASDGAVTQAMCNDVLVEPATLLDEARNVDDRACDDAATDACTPDGDAQPRITTLYGPRVETVNVHGTGDSLSSSLAALRPRFFDWRETAQAAKDWMVGAISGANDLHVGKGHGPIDFTWESAPTSQPFTDEYWSFLSRVRSERHYRKAYDCEACDCCAACDCEACDCMVGGQLDACAQALIAAATEATTADDRAFFTACAARIDALIAHGACQKDGQPCKARRCANQNGTESTHGEDLLREIIGQHSLGLLAAMLLPHLWSATLEFGQDLGDDESRELSEATARMAQIVNREARQASQQEYARMMDVAQRSTLQDYA